MGRLQHLLELMADFHFHRGQAVRHQLTAIHGDAVFRGGNQVGAGVQTQRIEAPLPGFIQHALQRSKGAIANIALQQPGYIPAGHRQRLCIVLRHAGLTAFSDQAHQHTRFGGCLNGSTPCHPRIDPP